MKCVGKGCFSAFKQGINHATIMSFDRDTDQSLKGMHVNSFVAGTFAIHSSTLYALLWPSAPLQPFKASTQSNSYTPAPQYHPTPSAPWSITPECLQVAPDTLQASSCGPIDAQ